MSETSDVVEAEKGRSLTPRNLHLRLRVVEIVVLVSLVLNLIQGFVGIRAAEKLQSQVESLKGTRGSVSGNLLLWLLGVPLPIIILISLLRSC